MAIEYKKLGILLVGEMYVQGETFDSLKRNYTSQSVYYLLRDTGVLWRRKKESKILSYMHDDPDTFARA